MCGIAGVVRRRAEAGRPPAEEVDKLLAHLAHRGPDAHGVHGAPNAAVGQTRLAIIDLVTGDPPIANEDGSVGAALNGEIYNYRALRAELRHDGHRLATQGDTEVIAHLADDHEPVELARKLDGMFAFATWDERRRRLVLGRDRLGKKPLYYWAGPDRFVFGSELKAVLAHPAVPRRLAADAIPAYLAFGYVPTPRTFYEGVYSVPPGHVLTVTPAATSTPVLERYWAPPVAGLNGTHVLDLTAEEAAAEIRRLLTVAIERRLMSDVPVGAFLSGGVDSSAIVAILSTLRDGGVPTFTIGFEDDKWFDERPFARQVAEQFGSEHLEFVVRADAAELIERLLWHHDQPFGDSSALPTLLLSELTRKHVTVALSGDGGDEIFAGYERFSAALARRYVDRAPKPLRRAITEAAELLPAGALRGRAPSVQRLLARPDIDTLGAYVDWVGFVPGDWRRRIVRPGSPGGGWFDDYRAIWDSSEGAAPLDRLLDLNLRTYLVDDLLPKMDRMSMAHALEVRSPFLDVDLLEFAARLPASMKLRGFSRKRVLKAAVADLLPREILNRRKHGFGLPLDRWFSADLAPWVESLLCSDGSRVRAHLDGEAVAAYVADHQHTCAHGHGIWALLTLELFLRREGW